MGFWALENAIILQFEVTTCEGNPRKIKYQHCYSWNRGNNIRCRFDESFRVTHWVHLERRRFYQFCDIHLSTIVSKDISFWQIDSDTPNMFIDPCILLYIIDMSWERMSNFLHCTQLVMRQLRFAQGWIFIYPCFFWGSIDWNPT